MRDVGIATSVHSAVIGMLPVEVHSPGMYSESAWFLVGGKYYQDIPADSPKYKISSFDVSEALPPSRVLFLTGNYHSLVTSRHLAISRSIWATTLTREHLVLQYFITSAIRLS